MKLRAGGGGGESTMIFSQIGYVQLDFLLMENFSLHITKKSIKKYSPLTPFLYIYSKMGFTVRLQGHTFDPKHRLWVFIRTASLGGSTCTHNQSFDKNLKTM